MMRLFSGSVRMRREVVPVEGLEFDAIRQSSLKLRQQVRRLGEMEGARTDEENVIGLHGSMLGGDRRPLDERQQIALHPFAGDIGADPLVPGGDLVDLVDEDDAVLLHGLDRRADHHLLVKKPVGFLGHQDGMALGDLHLAPPCLVAHHLAEDIVEIEHSHLGARHAGDVEGGQRTGAGILKVQFHLAVIEIPAAQPVAHLVAGLLACLVADQGVDDPFLGGQFGARLDLLAHVLAGAGDRGLHEITDDLLDIASDNTRLR